MYLRYQTTSCLLIIKQLLILKVQTTQDKTLEKEMADTALVRAGVLSTCRVVRLT